MPSTRANSPTRNIPSSLATVQHEIIDPKRDAAELAQTVFDKPMGAKEFRFYAYEILGRQRGENAYEELKENPNVYGLKVRQQDRYKFFETEGDYSRQTEDQIEG